jgi:hypothetical protein
LVAGRTHLTRSFIVLGLLWRLLINLRFYPMLDWFLYNRSHRFLNAHHLILRFWHLLAGRRLSDLFAGHFWLWEIRFRLSTLLFLDFRNVKHNLLAENKRAFESWRKRNKLENENYKKIILWYMIVMYVN